jgi:hypothetical protein
MAVDFKGPRAAGQLLSSSYTVSEDGEIFDSDDGGLSLSKKIHTPFRAGS